MIEAKIIRDSIGEKSPRLTTFQLRYPKFIHGEFMTHRVFSRNASSSRAIPVSKNLEEVRSDELRASPIYWGAEQRGMQSGDELDDDRQSVWWPDVVSVLNLDVVSAGEWVTERECVKRLWKIGANFAALVAQIMSEHGAHKSIVNRRMEADLHINVVATSTDPGLMNFFGLRLDRAAQPEIRVLAEAMWAAWGESTPAKLEPDNGSMGDVRNWHLPFVDNQTCQDFYDWRVGPTSAHKNDGTVPYLIKISVARCARVSYISFETGRRSTIAEDLALYDRLVGSRPLHASPAEHQATPDVWVGDVVKPRRETPGNLYDLLDWERWERPQEHGNLLGWVQYRKTILGEAVAPLPEGYYVGGQ